MEEVLHWATIEKEVIERRLRRGANLKKVAKSLGITTRALYKKRKQYEIERAYVNKIVKNTDT